MNKEQIISDLKNIVKPIHAHSDQLIAIADYVEHKVKNQGTIASGWISVDDRLPEDYNGSSDEYLILKNGDIYLATWYAHSYNDGVGDSHDGKVFMVPNMDSDYGGMFVAHNVTHWMPLPSAPH